MSKIRELERRLDNLKREERMLLRLRELLGHNYTALMAEQEHLNTLLDNKESLGEQQQFGTAETGTNVASHDPSLSDNLTLCGSSAAITASTSDFETSGRIREVLGDGEFDNLDELGGFHQHDAVNPGQPQMNDEPKTAMQPLKSTLDVNTCPQEGQVRKQLISATVRRRERMDTSGSFSDTSMEMIVASATDLITEPDSVDVTRNVETHREADSEVIRQLNKSPELDENDTERSGEKRE